MASVQFQKKLRQTLPAHHQVDQKVNNGAGELEYSATRKVKVSEDHIRDELSINTGLKLKLDNNC